jgi:hypothetical protein
MKYFVAFMYLFCLLFLVGCPKFDQIQVQAANSVAIASNAALPVLVAEYKQQGVTEINLSKTEEEATKRVLVIEQKWHPVWMAWEVLRTAHDTWSTILESGGDTLSSFLAIKNAYCGLIKIWPAEIRAIPMAGIVCEVK